MLLDTPVFCLQTLFLRYQKFLEESAGNVRNILSSRTRTFRTLGGVGYLTVKTLDESAVYEPYDRTQAFYFKNGFTPLEVFTTFWNEENPCLFLIKHV